MILIGISIRLLIGHSQLVLQINTMLLLFKDISTGSNSLGLESTLNLSGSGKADAAKPPASVGCGESTVEPSWFVLVPLLLSGVKIATSVGADRVSGYSSGACCVSCPVDKAIVFKRECRLCLPR